MNNEINTRDTNSILESLTHTLLYEGYSLYPYYRSAVKNQKPIPFGVISPKNYNAYHEHSHSNMQSQCIISGSFDITVSIDVRFLHVRKTELFKKNNNGDEFLPVFSLEANGKNYQSGWQTIERKITTGPLPVSELIKNSKCIPVEFEKTEEVEIIFDNGKEVVGKCVTSIRDIRGGINIEADEVPGMRGSFRITISVINTTPLKNADIITRDEAFLSSFLSTHIVLRSTQGKFISHHDPPVEWKDVIASCNNINTWPILIDNDQTTLLSSPIILYDYPEINPQSSGDLFDSTEIEEALLLHVNLLSEEDRKKIGTGDEKMNAMLQKVSSITPENLHQYHSMMKGSPQADLL